MTVKKGLATAADQDPEFSNQELENATDALKIGWVIKSFQLDQTIADNEVLSTSQKNDLKDAINNVQYLNVGRIIGDIIRHTTSVLDGSIVPDDSGLPNPDPTTFIELVSQALSVKTLIPQLYGISASNKNRDLDDHFGTLNRKFQTTEDSSEPVFDRMRSAIQFIVDANLSSETDLETAYDNLKNFIDSVRADSTDFQQTLDTFGTAVATAHTNFNNALNSEPNLSKRNLLSDAEQEITTQLNLENSNITSLETYLKTLSNSLQYSGLAADTDVRTLFQRIARNTAWKTYFTDYEENIESINPVYNTIEDSAKAPLIDKIYADAGLPDVLDSIDLSAVAAKAKRDNRIDTAGFDTLTDEQVITKSCQQLNIDTVNRSIYFQSESLLDNMNTEDKEKIARLIDLNQSANTNS
jgi:hypothetical protein